MELLQLRYFFESSKNESFAKTAEKFMVPSSSVSASVKRLENELGCSLFDRSSNCILLNDNGRQLQKSLCVIFDELEQTISKLTPIENDHTEIKILVRSLRDKITDQIIKYHLKHPMVKFYTSFDFSESKLDYYDIIIDEENDRYTQYERFELSSYQIGIKASAENPLCKRTLRLSQLRNHPFISMGESGNLHRILIKACKKVGFTPNIIMQTNDISCYKKCIESGVGLALSRKYSNTVDETAKIRFLTISDFNERQTIYVYYKKQSEHGNIKMFMNSLRSDSFQ